MAADPLELSAEYESSLGDLTVNSKPLINTLTMLAEENIAIAPLVVQTIEKHLQKVSGNVKLPSLYLIDSILKNVGKEYTALFMQNLVSMFCETFDKVDEKTRSQMYKLRQTWTDVLPPMKLFELDTRVATIDPAWPIAPVASSSNNRVYLNPKFLNSTSSQNDKPPTFSPTPIGTTSASNADVQKQKKKLLELEKEKKQLEKEVLARRQQQHLAQQQQTEKPKAPSDLDMDTVVKLTDEVDKILKLALLQAQNAAATGDKRKSDEALTSVRNAMIKKKYLSEYLSSLKTKSAGASGIKSTPPLTATCPLAESVLSPGVINSGASMLSVTSSASSPSVPTVTKPLSQSSLNPETVKTKGTATSSINISTVVTKPQSVPVKPVTSSSQIPRVTINPASSQLINAASQRVRDPRLRKPKDEKSTDSSSRTSVSTPVIPAVHAPETVIKTRNSTVSNSLKASQESGAGIIESVPSKEASKSEKKNDRSKDKEKRRKMKKSSKQSESHPSSPSKQTDFLNNSLTEKFLESVIIKVY